MFTAILLPFYFGDTTSEKREFRKTNRPTEKQEKFLGQQQQEKSPNGNDSLRLESGQFRQKKKSLGEVIPRKRWNCQIT